MPVYLKVNGIEMSVSPGAKWKELVERLPDGGKGALGVCVQGRSCSLEAPAEEYAYARTLTLADEEGRRIYERSLLLLFLAALRRLYPDARARIQHSYGQGLYVAVDNPAPFPGMAAAIEAEMRGMARADMPIRRLNVSTQDAAEYFARTGQTERLRVLRYREFKHFTLYDLDGYEDYFYGEMAPSTGYLTVLKVLDYAPGLILMRPSLEHPDQPGEFKDLPKLARTFQETSKWQAILDCRNAADLNDMVVGHRLREFIRVSEALQEGRIQRIADQFIQSGARVMLIAGPSSSGKTTFAHRLNIALRVHGLRPVKLSLDDYYRNRDELPLEADGSVDLERLDTLDTALLWEHLPRLLAGETVEVPEFDFKTGRRREHTHPMRVEQGQPIIIEGIHGLNDELTRSVPREMKFKIYISALTTLNLDDHNRIRTTDARLLRRIVRDNLFRGTLPEETMAMWASVRRGEEKYIFPFQEQADAMFNSTLPYELPIMKKYAFPLLKAVQPESPYYTLARRLVKFLNYVRVADVEDEIPVNSILREFIGGCCFYRETD